MAPRPAPSPLPMFFKPDEKPEVTSLGRRIENKPCDPLPLPLVAMYWKFLVDTEGANDFSWSAEGAVGGGMFA